MNKVEIYRESWNFDDLAQIDFVIERAEKATGRAGGAAA